MYIMLYQFCVGQNWFSLVDLSKLAGVVYVEKLVMFDCKDLVNSEYSGTA